MKKSGWILAVLLAAYGIYALSGRSSDKGAAPVAKPRAGQVEIAPASAFANSTLQVRVLGARRGDPGPASCRWFKNGAEIMGADSTTLSPSNFRKGDAIEVEVVVDAGGEPVRTAEVRIQNTPPRIMSAVANLRAEPSARVYVEAKAADADGDPMTYTYQWYRNGDEIPGETDETLDVSRVRMGDKVFALITASDGRASSSPQKSEPITIGSNAPDITSTPPATLGEGRRFVYQVSAHAPDPRTLRYELVEAPDGMTMDRGGLIEWTVPEATENAQSYAVAVRVSDPTGGEAVQRFTVSTSIQKGSTQ